MEQEVKSRKKKKLVVNGKRVFKKFNDKCFICNKTGHLVKYCRNKGKQENLMKKIIQVNVTEVHHFTNKVL
jgi:hypothetical protein